MPLSEASALTKLHLEIFSPRADQIALDKLAAWCEQFSPTVATQAPDCLLMDISGLGHLFGGEELLVVQIQRAFQRLGLVARIAVTNTFTAAWAISHFYERNVAIVTPDDNPESLAHLPVRSLNLSDEINATLSELGIEEIGELFELSRESLAARFDPQLLERLDQATGRIQESISPYHAIEDLTASFELENPASDRRMLEFMLEELLKPLIPKLLAERKGITKFTCEFRGEWRERSEFQISLYQPTSNLKHLRELIELQLEKLVLPGPINKVRLMVNNTALLATSQLELFEEENTADNKRQVSLLVNRLSSRLGEAAVLKAVLVADSQAEFAYRYQPVVFAKQRRIRKSVNVGKPSQRPIQLLPVPAPLKVLGVLNGSPKQFHWRGQTHEIQNLWGPERIEVGWWRGNYVKRDYFRVETEMGNRYWIFRDRAGHWFLHGIFD